MSQQLATINMKAPLEIGLEDTLLKEKMWLNWVNFMMKWDFHNSKVLLADGGGEVTDETVSEEIKFEIVTDKSSVASVNADDFFYLETLGENYHREQIVAFAWGNSEKIYVSKI